MKYQRFEQVPNKYGGFVKYYEDTKHHRAFVMGKHMHHPSRVAMFKFFLSKTAYKARVHFVKGYRFKLERGECCVSAPEVMQELGIKRGVFDEFIKNLVKFETIELKTKKGIGHFMKFINYDKYQARNAKIPFDETNYNSFIGQYDEPETKLKPNTNLRSYIYKDIKTEREKELVSNGQLTFFENQVKEELLKIYTFIHTDFENKYQHFKCESFLKVSKKFFKGDYQKICNRLHELGFEAEAERELNDPPFILNKYMNFLKCFEKGNFKGEFLTFSLFLTKFKEYFERVDHVAIQDEVIKLEKQEYKDVTVELDDNVKNVHDEFHNALKKCTPLHIYNFYFMNVVICKFKQNDDSLLLDILYATGAVKYHVQSTFYKYLDQALTLMSAKVGEVFIYANQPTNIHIQSNI